VRLKELEDQHSKLTLAYRAEWEREGIDEVQIQDMLKSNPTLTELYDLIQQERTIVNRPQFDLNEFGDISRVKLIILDECSMVGSQIASDILSLGIKILVLGDPGQLPPIGDEGFFIKDQPDILLDEIHRQAKDSPILWLATKVRLGEKLDLGTYGDSRVIMKNQLTADDMLKADQNICGMNSTRHAYNRRIRELIYGESHVFPQKEDKMICLRNNHDLGLVNGAMFFVKEVAMQDDDFVTMSLWDERFEELSVQAHSKLFTHPSEPLDYWRRRDAEEFYYAYVITGHKSQGSQWDTVTVIDESFVFRADRSKWLYTAITRASNKITIVKT
jgi:exodeoxyribonuclease-5